MSFSGQSAQFAESSALAGVRVLEVDCGLAQYAGKLLADLGAEVVKIEPPTGAATRLVPPFEAGTSNSLHFAANNIGKKSVSLDLATPTGRSVFLDLVANADVVLDGAGVDTLSSHQLGFPALAERNPALVHTSVTPFGQSGPWRSLHSCDLVQMALGGVMASSGYDDEDVPGAPPICPVGGHSLFMGGVFAATGTLAAVLRRELTGRGDAVDVALHDCVSVTTEMAVPAWEFQGKTVRRHTGRHSSVLDHTPRWIVPCGDGHYILALTLYLTDSRFRAMVGWFAESGMDEDLAGPEWAAESYRAERMNHIVDVIARFCARHERDWLFHEAQRRRLPWAPINTVDELIGDPHLVSRATFDLARTVTGAEFAHPGPGYHAPGLVGRSGTAAPGLGQHTDDVLRDVAGVEPHALALLRASATC